MNAQRRTKAGSKTKGKRSASKTDSAFFSKNKEFQELKKLLPEAKRILISTHELPDGDGLGAELALFQYLKRARKACRVYNPDPVPNRYRFLDPNKAILHGPSEVELWDTCDLWIIVDTNDPRRLGKVWPEMSLRAKKIFFLDHHPPITAGEVLNYPPHASVITEDASSSIGELLYHLFAQLEMAELNKDIALGLYVSVMTDTNSFRYSRTTPSAHQIAAQCIELGVNPEEVYQNIYSSKALTHLQLLGHMLQNVKVSHHGKLAWLEMDFELRKRHKASSDDTQSFLNILLLLKDAEVVCFFREEDNSHIRVSIKSKGKVVVNKVAMEFGGGGHDYAAGFSVSATMKKTVETVCGELTRAIDHHERFGK